LATALSPLLDAMGDDLGALVSAIGSYVGNKNVAFVAAPAQAVRAALFTD
jgi:hypothetical protein